MTNFSRRAFLGTSAAVALATAILPRAVLAQTPVKGGNFILGLKGGESTNTLDPALSLSHVTYHAIRAFGESMFEVGTEGEIVPRLAETYEALEGGKVWTFDIRQGVKFHDGSDLTADDVLATLERHSDENSQSGAYALMEGIESMSVEGQTLTVTLSTPSADLPYLLADYHLVIQPNGGKDDAAAGIATGPYRVTVNEPGVRYVFEKFPEYWDDTRGHYDTHEIRVINDDTARQTALQSRQVHAINQVQPRTAHLLGRAPGVVLQTTDGKGHYIFVMHCDKPPFDNYDLRMALKYAINREELVEKILAGYGTVGNDTPINAAYPLFDDSIEQRAYDVDKAKEHYAKSGHDGSPIVLHVSDAAFAGAVDAAQLFQQSAAACGITIELKREPDDGYWSEVWNKAPFCASYWGGRSVQDQMWSTGYLSTAEWNDTRFKNAEFDALLLEARAELDQDRRKELYGQMARIERDQGGLINPMFNQFVEGLSDKVQGWETNREGGMMNGFVASKTWMA